MEGALDTRIETTARKRIEGIASMQARFSRRKGAMEGHKKGGPEEGRQNTAPEK